MSRPRVLVVEDDADTADVIAHHLRELAEATSVPGVGDARKALAADSYDLVLLDVNLPDGSGFDFCAELQGAEATRRTPVIVLTARGDLPDRVRGLDLGADDYLVKPVAGEELRARVKARLRRAALAAADASQVVELGDLKINRAAQMASLASPTGDTPLDLTPHEFKILHLLALNPGAVFERPTLIELLWGADVHVVERTIDTHVSNLRRKLAGSSLTIVGVRGKGYRLVPRDSQADDGKPEAA